MRIFVIKTYFDLFNIVLESFLRFYTTCIICIEAVVLKTKCIGRELEVQKMPKIGYCMFGPRQGIPGSDRVQEIPRIGYCWFWIMTGDSWPR